MRRNRTQPLVAAAILCGLGVLLPGARAADTKPKRESYSVVLVSDIDRSKEYKVMTTTERRELQSVITTEARAFPRALIEAEKEWKQGATTGKKPFPRNAIHRRNIKLIATYARVSAAEQKVNYYLEREERKKNKPKKDKSKFMGPNLQHFKKNNKGEKDKQRQELTQKAVEIFRTKLSETIAAIQERQKPRTAGRRTTVTKKQDGGDKGGGIDLDL
jgi:hypothetical protein